MARHIRAAILLIVVPLMASCGGGTETTTPAAPDTRAGASGATPAAAGPTTSGTQSKLKGAVGSVTAACPALTFTVLGTTVTTTSATIFKHGICADVRPDVDVEVEGIAGTNGTLAAAEVEIDIAETEPPRTDPDDDDHELRGTVSLLSGACPAISFSVAGRAVAANASTQYKRGVCGDVRDGSSVEVHFTPQRVGTVSAIEIEFER